jgi:arylsulfatase A-like enzyme
MPRRLAGLLLFCLLAAASGCGIFRDAPPPHLVLITIDTTRADRLGCYGYGRDTSPALDALAAESILFERCFAPMATTFPSHLSLLTGTYPLEHGSTANVTHGAAIFRPGPHLRSWAQILQDAGYRTAAFVSATPVKRVCGIDAGFAEWDEPGGYQRRAKLTCRLAREWLARQGEEPFFLWIHLFDPHSPWDPPAPYDTMFQTDDTLRGFMAERRFRDRPGPHHPSLPPIDVVLANNLYDGEIRFLDAQLGELLDDLRGREDLWRRTAVVVMGDHGEGLGQHNDMHHGGIWEEQLHVPLMMRIPGEQPRRVPDLLSVVDVLPTLLGRTGFPGEEELLAQASGRDRLARGGAGLIFAMESDADWRRSEGRPVPQFSLRDDQWTFVHVPYGADWLYHRPDDPFELDDVAGRHPALVDSLRRTVEDLIAAQARRGEQLHEGAPTDTLEVDQKTIEELRSLGYIH